ncbi:MAG: 50S ribosomal protein L3 [Deltaproteobacteria bacterium]|nr:50S ribosomal protein L3 [Deltaproteobacteria bacterium]
MSRAILGKKLGMTQIFDDVGHRIPVTVLAASPNIVVQKRTPAKHKYSAIQIGFEEIPGRKLNKPRLGTFERLDLKTQRYLREVRMTPEEVDAYKIGDQITVSIFEDGDFVDVVAVSKGRGFQGVVKKYGMAGGTATRGTHENMRHPGSIGNCEFPGKVWKGRRLPGQMGNKRVTIQNLRLLKVDTERNLLLIKGAIPGAKNGLVMVQKAVKKQRSAKKKALLK